MKHILLFLLLALVSCASYKGKLSYTVRENLNYKNSSDIRTEGDVFIPEGTGPFPGVVVVHGGGWQSRSREDMNSTAASLATNGFVVFNINYRFSPKDRHPAPIDDLEVALDYFKSRASDFKLDPARIGLWGYSSGGHTVSYYALTRAHDPKKKVQAVVAGGAPYDFTWYPHSPYIRAYTGVYRDQNLKLYEDASVVNHVTPEAPPFYLFHGDKDRLVEYAQMTALEAKFVKHGVYVKTERVPFWGHAMAFAWPDKPVEKGILFLKKKL